MSSSHHHHSIAERYNFQIVSGNFYLILLDYYYLGMRRRIEENHNNNNHNARSLTLFISHDNDTKIVRCKSDWKANTFVNVTTFNRLLHTVISHISFFMEYIRRTRHKHWACAYAEWKPKRNDVVFSSLLVWWGDNERSMHLNQYEWTIFRFITIASSIQKEIRYKINNLHERRYASN